MTQSRTPAKPRVSKRPPSPRKGKPLGDRVTVAVGKDKNGRALYSYMMKAVADYFAFPALGNTPTRNNKFGEPVPSRGSKGRSIKVAITEAKQVTIKKPAATNRSPAQHYSPPAARQTKTVNTKRVLSIPMPAGMTIAKITAFLQTAKKNKPTEFVSSGGRTYPVVQKKAGNK